MRAIFFFEGEWKTGRGKQTFFFYEVADEIITKQRADEALILVCTQMYKTWTMHWIWRASQKQRRTSCPLNTQQSCCTHPACSVSFGDAVPTRQKGTQPFRISSVELHGIHFHVVLSKKKQKLYPRPPPPKVCGGVNFKYLKTHLSEWGSGWGGCCKTPLPGPV